MQKITTGYIGTVKGQKGLLEFLSIGDFGKEANIKADFLGYTKPIDGVKAKNIKPLSEKWVITLSSQYGCPMKCVFCDVPKVKFKGNASIEDLLLQVKAARDCFPKVKYTERLNIHFARMGEPLFNIVNISAFAIDIRRRKKYFQDTFDLRCEVIHPVISTMLPKSIDKKETITALKIWHETKNYFYNGQAGLQFSINTTDDKIRKIEFNGRSHDLETISYIADKLPYPVGRKYTLNFAIHDKTVIDANKLSKLFDPEKFICKITPIHNNQSCRENNIKLTNGYNMYNSYNSFEKELKEAGFDVLVFIPHVIEDKEWVTCGNLRDKSRKMCLKN